MDGNGILYPDRNGVIICTIKFDFDPSGEKRATVIFGGQNQALITFDASGGRVVSHMLLDPAPNVQVMHSVNNVISYLNTI